MTTAIAHANPNIAFIKYWGNRDSLLRIPANGSISMNLEGLESRTQVSFDPGLKKDKLTINGIPLYSKSLERVSVVLDLVRQMVELQHFARVESNNNFPPGRDRFLCSRLPL
jgi:diphosphomevalonate decarboxylase